MDTFEVFESFFMKIKNEFGSKVKIIHRDHGTEFENKNSMNCAPHHAKFLNIRLQEHHNRMGWLSIRMNLDRDV